MKKKIPLKLITSSTRIVDIIFASSQFLDNLVCKAIELIDRFYFVLKFQITDFNRAISLLSALRWAALVTALALDA